MSTISCAVARAGIIGYRTNISGQQWTECQTARAGLIADPDDELRIGSEFASIITVDTWDPANNETNVMHGQTVSAKMDTDNTAEKEVLYDEGSDFDTGVHNSTRTVTDHIELQPESPFIDFENYVLNDSLVNYPTQPDEWSQLDQKNSYDASIRLDPDDSNNYVVRNTMGGSFVERRLDDAGVMYAGVLTVRVKWPDDGNNEFFPMFQMTGSGTGLRGYCMTFAKNSTYTYFKRMNDWDSFYGIRSDNHGINFADDTWYWIKVRFYGTSSTSAQYKVWEDGDSEPGSWSWGGSDSTYTREGYVGLGTVHASGWWSLYWDDFSIEPDPAQYATSGDWQTGILDMTSVVGYSHGLITWDEVKPTNTTIAVKARWPGGSWLACTNDDKLPGIIYTEKMVAGSGHDELELKVELGTTDTSATPEVSNIRVYYEPLRIEEIELNVDSVACTLANEKLAWWGRGWLAPATGGVPPTLEADWDDITAATKYAWYANDGETITAILKYYANVIETITFTAEETKFRMAYQVSSWLALDDPYPSGPTGFSWTALQEWFPTGHDYYWVMLDKGQAMHADGWWICGYPVRNDFPVSLTVGQLQLDDHPASLLVQGYKRNDHPLSLLVQGYRYNDFPLSLLPGIWKINDHPVSVVAGQQYLADHPTSIVVYGVNREGMIEVNIIDDDTWTELSGRGFTRS